MAHSPSVARRSDAILVLVDLQERLSAAMANRANVLAAVNRLLSVAALTGVPVVVTRQYPDGLGDVEPVLRSAIEAASSSIDVSWADKVAFDCFAEPSFAEQIAALGRKQLIIAGMETHICVTQTALSGVRGGYDAHVVGDACCSRDATTHELALSRMRHAGATVTCTESVLYELVGAAGSGEFRELLRIVKA